MRDQQIDKGLIIFDHSDKFAKNNNLELEMHLNYLSKEFGDRITFIFLSDKKLDKKYNL